MTAKVATTPRVNVLDPAFYVDPWDAYRWLRRVEHRLQMVRDIQTHDLPSDHHAIAVLARSLGFTDPDAYRSEWQRVIELVRGLHERLFYRPLTEALAASAAPPPGFDRASTEELLAALGFADPPTAYELLVNVAGPATRSSR